MNMYSFTLRLNEVELTAPPIDTVAEQNADNQGFYNSMIKPTLENPLPSVGIFLALVAGTVAVRRALHRDPKPWLEDR